MGDTGTEIIIKGGSVEVNFASSVYQKDPGDPGKHRNNDRKITRIQVTDESGKSMYDSGTSDDGMKCTITVSTK